MAKNNIYSRIMTPERQFLLDMVRSKTGLIFDEHSYLKDKVIQFYKLGDPTKTAIKSVAGWDDVNFLAYSKPKR